MKRKIFAAILAIFAFTLAACGGSSSSSSADGQASNRAVATAVDSNTGIAATGVCNGNPDAGAVGNINGVVDNDAGTYYGAKSVKSDGGANHAGEAVVDCTMTISFGSQAQGADSAKIVGTVTGSWLDNYSQFYFYQSLHAVADVYTLDAAGQKTLIPSQEQVEEIDPHCIGETFPDTNQTQCQFAVSAGSATDKLAANVSGVEFAIHFYTNTSATTCFTGCTATIEPHITGTEVVKSGVTILSTGS